MSSGPRRVAVVDRERLDNWCEKGILGLVLAMLVYAPLALGAVRYTEFLVVIGLETLALVLWLIRIWIRPQYRMLAAPISWFVIAFAGFAVYEYFHADVEYLARRELLEVVSYAFFFFLVVDNLSKQENLQFILLALVFLAMVIAGYAVVQSLTGSTHVLWYNASLGYKGRASGTFYNPNHLAGFLELLLPIALAFVLVARMKALWKIFIGYAALVIIAGIGVTVSRGAWISCGISLFVFFAALLLNRDFRVPAAVLLGVLALTAGFFGTKSLFAQKRFEEAKRFQDRYLWWRPAVEMWKTSPWTGVGPNHFDVRFRHYRHWQAQFKPRYTHNDYLNTLADYGVIGSTLILGALGCLVFGVARTWKYVRRTNEIVSRPSTRAAAVLGASAGLLAILAHSVTDFNMHIPANALIAVTLMAVLTSHLRYATERFWFNPGALGRIGATLVLAGGIAWLSSQIWSLGHESYFLEKATKEGFPSKERLDLLQKAYAYEPNNEDTTWEIGELIRRWAWQGDEGYQNLLREALPWFERSSQLNKWDPYPVVSRGMCLHWLNEHEKAKEAFDQALAMDPNGYYVIGFYGWHLLQIGDLKGAREWLQKSYSYNWWNNTMAQEYLKIVERRLAEENQKH